MWSAYNFFDLNFHVFFLPDSPTSSVINNNIASVPQVLKTYVGMYVCTYPSSSIYPWL